MAKEETQKDKFSIISTALDKKFIYSEKVAQILSLAFEGNKNCLLWGDGGHAKSYMTNEAVDALGMTEDCFVQSFGEGMDESRLWGGIHYGKLESENLDERAIEYHAERSFLNKRVAVFEELFDAPSMVLLALKDTLTAKCLRNGSQQFPMKTECIIALTNHDPVKISQMGAAEHALVERFPLQHKVEWSKYNGDAYTLLFEKVKPDIDDELRGRLAFMIERAINEGSTISPRSAIHAIETLIVAQQQGLDERAMYQSLAFVPGFEPILDTIDEEIKEAEERRRALDSLTKVEKLITKEIKQLESTDDAALCIRIRNKIANVRDDLSKLPIPDNLIEQRDKLMNNLKETMDAATERSYAVAGMDEDGDVALTTPADKSQGEEHEPEESESTSDSTDETPF